MANDKYKVPEGTARDAQGRPVVGKKVYGPFPIAGWALGFDSPPQRMQERYQQWLKAGNTPDVIFGLVWTHTAMHLADHDHRIEALEARVAELEGKQLGKKRPN